MHAPYVLFANDRVEFTGAPHEILSLEIDFA